MKDYFAEHAHEFGSMLYTEWDWDEMLEVARDVAREEGHADGHAEGLAESKTETARQMKADGMDAALIAKYTGLSVAEVSAL